MDYYVVSGAKTSGRSRSSVRAGEACGRYPSTNPRPSHVPDRTHGAFAHELMGQWGANPHNTEVSACFAESERFVVFEDV
jgi:hypothetical protein